MRIGFGDFCGWDFDVTSVDTRPLGGSQSAACHLARALAQRGHEVSLLSHTTSPGKRDGVCCMSWASTPVAELRLLKFDVFVCLLNAGNGVLLRSALDPETRLILWTQHSFDQPGVLPLQHAPEWDSYDAFVFVSEWQRRQFVARFAVAPEKTCILRNAVAPVFENLIPGGAPLYTIKTRPPVLAYTSTPFRGLDLLLEAFPAIRAAVPRTRLRVFSSMKVYQIQQAADDAQFGALYARCRAIEGVEYVGSLSQQELAAEMESVTALAYPNTFAETSCIAVLEAMAAGCHVITSDLGALPETTAGFARLVSAGQDHAGYLRQFTAQTVEAVQSSLRGDSAAEAHLQSQILHIRENATWCLRAAEWEKWLASVAPG